jgi:CheY-like chemotaxis protein
MTLKVFVADDSVTIQKIVSLAFSQEDVVIEAVSNGDAALEALQRCKPDIVLADVFMPGCSGYEVCARVKEDPELQHIPVVLLVGTFEPFDESEASRVKCDGHLTKPFDTSELIHTVYMLVGNKISSGAQTKKDSSMPRFNPSIVGGLVSKASLASFLGDNPILDILNPATAPSGGGTATPPATESADRSVPVKDLSEDALNLIVDRVVRKMSPEIIREVAWEVVPELSETIIRRTIKERQ